MMVRWSGKLSFHILIRSSAGRCLKVVNKDVFACRSFEDSGCCGIAADSDDEVLSGGFASLSKLSLVAICVISIFLGELEIWSDAEIVKDVFGAYEHSSVLASLMSGTPSCVCVVRLSSSLGEISQDWSRWQRSNSET